jgi:PAS domain-containing protein
LSLEFRSLWARLLPGSGIAKPDSRKIQNRMTSSPEVPTRGVAPSESLYRLWFQNTLDGLMLTAPDGSILDANPATGRIPGRTREEILY